MLVTVLLSANLAWMAKSFKSHNVVSVGSGNGDARLWQLQTESRKKSQQVNTHSVIVAAVRNSQVIPTASPQKESSKEQQYLTLTFREAYGALGMPMVIILVVCIVWTNCLICVALIPNQVANWLMGTSGYDNGQFWLIIDTDPVMIKIGAAGLAFVNSCYVYIVMKMLCWQKTVLHLQLVSPRLGGEHTDSATDSWIRTTSARCKTQYVELTSFRGSKRKLWNVCLKILNLTMQVTVLLELLETGTPTALVYSYTALISVGSLAGAIKIVVGKISAMEEIIAGSVFDLFAAIVFPIIVLVYCYYNFQFDDAVFATYLKILPVGSYEHSARVFADPSEIALFRLAFDSLRIRSQLDFVLRVGINLSFCYRLKRIGEVLIATQLRRAQSVRTQRNKPPRNFQRPVPRVLAVFFVAFSVVVWIFANQAITDSNVRCSKYPQCVVYAYRWKLHGDVCPCRILIDVDPAPQTYEDWIHPIDAYNTVQVLAISGELRALQLINRQLLELPDELLMCRYLSSMELVYTGIQSIPSWVKEFKHLQILHLEGKLGHQNLRDLPEDLFSDMPWLSTIHIGVHQNLGNFPSLSGVPNLKRLTLAWLLELHTLPPFGDLPHLHTILIVLMPHLEEIPDLASLTGLLEFTLSRPIQLCCNGFRGTCDLADNYCVENSASGIPAASCITGEPFLGNAGTRKVFDKFNASICQKLPSDLLAVPGEPTKQTIEMCDSKPFAQCELPDGGTGICYNTRMQVLSCYGDENYIKLRRYQIQMGVRKKCDPVLEKWLGCNE